MDNEGIDCVSGGDGLGKSNVEKGGTTLNNFKKTIFSLSCLALKCAFRFVN